MYKAVQLHVQYYTIVSLIDKNGICGVCRFNITNVDEAYIVDVAVRKDLRYKDILQRLLRMGLEIWTSIKQLRFYSQDNKREFVVPVNMVLKKEK